MHLREAFITDRSASESAEEKKRVIIEAEERYVSCIPLVKMEKMDKHNLTTTNTLFSWIYFVHSSIRNIIISVLTMLNNTN